MRRPLLGLLLLGISIGVLCKDPSPDAEFQTVGNKAMADFNASRYKDALKGFKRLKEIQPENVEIVVATAQCLQAMGKLQAALEEFNTAAQMGQGQGKNVPGIYLKMAELLKDAGDGKQALEAYTAAVEHPEATAQEYVMRGAFYQQSDRYQDALKDFNKAVNMDPNSPTAWSGLGIAYMYMEHVDPGGKPENFQGSYDDAAIYCLRQTMDLQPDSMTTLSNLVMAENRVCDWSQRTEHFKQLKKALKNSVAARKNFAPPFHAFEFGYTPKEMELNSRYLARQIERDAAADKKKVPQSKALNKDSIQGPGDKLRVAYVSGAGFHNGTTTARCLQSMFGMHDKSRVHVTGVALSGDDQSPERKKIKESCDSWIEGRDLTTADVATKVSKEGVHILVDTTGYTMRARTELLPAASVPIVFNFHGFPGTMAAPFVHYLCSDKLTTPPEYQSFYTEKLVIVPYTYLINDHKQSRREVLGENAPSNVPNRSLIAEFEEDDIILASFNQLYKIDPKIFAAWMKILKAVPNSKMWFLRFSSAAERYLWKAAKAAGVDPDRLRFTNKFDKDIELIVKGKADLFLDTPLFNAHTTGGDVLWAGVPILTMPRENFASRVASGLIHSTSTHNHMIARKYADYTDLGIKLCQNAAARKRVTDALKAERESAPLFDTKKLTGHVEVAMRAMWDVYASDHAPMHIVVNRA